MVNHANHPAEIDAAKAQLALCIRMLEQQGTLDYNGHCSIRIADDRMLINGGNAQRSTITVADICTIDMAGQVIEGRGKPPLEFHLHAGLYRARSDVGAIVHAHPRWSTYLTMTGTPYLPVFAQGSLLYPVPVLDTPNSINTRQMADQLAQTLGDRPAVLMKSHGAAVVGTDIIAAFVLATYLEENAERQFMAQQLGKPYVFTDEEMAACRAKLSNTTLFEKAWNHFAAKVAM
jgi:L-fuculose-phosphate aldolase